MCLHTKRGDKKILGYFKNTKLTSRNGILSMEVIGDNCLKANVSFHCDYSAPAGGIVRIFPNDDNGCSYDISVKLPSVCVTKLNGDGDRSKVCSIKSGTSTTYDLTALTKYDENYRILNNNSGSTVEFQLNICNPLITGDATSLCKPQTAICLHNTSEPNFKKRFFTIGNYPGTLKFENDQLSLEFNNGDMCSNRQFASAKINFQCTMIDRNHEAAALTLAETDGCRYEFVWLTNVSCPRIEPVVVETTPQTSYRNSSCVIPYDSGKVINLTSIERKQFQIYHEKERANLTFNVCTMNYTKTYTNGRKEILYFNRTITYKNMEYYLGHQINCETTTSDDSNWNSLNMKLDCRYDDDDDVVFKLLYINNCTAYIQCNSALFCENNTRNSANPFAIEADQLQNVIEVLLQKWPNLTLNVRDVDIKRPRSDAQNAASKNENRKIKKNEENSVERGQQQQAPSTIYRNVTVCIITIGTKEIYLNKLAPVTLKSRSGNRYTIGMGGVEGGGGRQRERANMCNDYICKDGKTVATLNTCPNVSVVVNNSNGGGGDVSRSSPEVLEQEQPFVTTMFLKCNLNSNNNEKSIANFEVNDQLENDTSLTLSYPMEEVCLAPPVSSSSNVVLLAVGCIILTVSLIGCYRNVFLIQTEDVPETKKSRQIKFIFVC
ncbi:Cation-independent mannose-6-phosphate receptor repeat [Popillia japonica]|uniref:Cation-independent mannose-6-phosphate receptor repeat n=1 Tax=Popillia japonica TaxID=7064 RepID=A0AAW1N9C7_POPJA